MLDQQIVALAKAIRQHETGNRPIAGATGELKSRYQYLPSTWKSTAGKYLGNPNAELTLENENKATYLKLADWKKQGYNPGQIASMWNSGNPDMYAKGDKGIGKSSANPNVTFNVPKYVESVYANYQKFKPKEKTQYQKDLLAGIEEKPTFFQPKPEEVRFKDVLREGWGVGKSVINYFKDKFTEAKDEQKDLARREDEGEINKLAEFIGKAGIGADVITSTAYDTLAQSIKGLGLLSEKISDEEGVIDDAKKKVVNKAIDFFNTETGKGVLEIVEAGEQEWNKFEQSNPSLAEIVKGTAKVGELALIGGTKTGRETAEAVVKPIRAGAAVTGEALEATGKKLISGVEKQVLREVEDIVSPKITKKVKDIALNQGRINKKGVYTLSAFEKEVADVAKDFVKKGNTPQENISSILKEIGRESDELAKTLQQNDAIFNASQLRKRIAYELKDVDDIMIDEKRLNKAKNEITDLLIDTVENKKLSSLWEARKKFDSVIDKKLNVFAGVSTVKKDIGLAVRRAVNDFIVQKSPQLVKEGKHPFSDAMAKMNRLFTAKTNIADKILPSQLNQTTLGNLGRKLKSVSHKVGAIQGGLAMAGIFSLGQALFNPAVIGAILAFGSYKVGKTVVTSKMLRKAIGTVLEKAGKLLNPQDKKYLRSLAVELDKSIKSEAGFTKLPGKGVTTITDDTLYHGTSQAFEVFDTGKMANGNLGKGVYLTNSKRSANYYGRLADESRQLKSGVFPPNPKAKILNIKIADNAKIKKLDKMPKTLDEIEAIKNQGYDGIEYPDEILNNVEGIKNLPSDSRATMMFDTKKINIKKPSITDDIAKAKAEGKTFDEFVSSKEKVYHGTNVNFPEEKIGVGDGYRFSLMGKPKKIKSPTTFFSSDKKTAQRFADERTDFFKRETGDGGSARVLEYIIEPKKTANLTSPIKASELLENIGISAEKYVRGIPPLDGFRERTLLDLLQDKDVIMTDLYKIFDNKEVVEKFKKFGFDSARIREVGDLGESLAVFDKSVIKTKSQLKQLWDKQ